MSFCFRLATQALQRVDYDSLILQLFLKFYCETSGRRTAGKGHRVPANSAKRVRSHRPLESAAVCQRRPALVHRLSAHWNLNLWETFPGNGPRRKIIPWPALSTGSPVASSSWSPGFCPCSHSHGVKSNSCLFPGLAALSEEECKNKPISSQRSLSAQKDKLLPLGI